MSNGTPLDTAEREQATTHHLEFDPITESASEELIKAVAALEGANPTELILLADFIDPEALDALFEPLMDGTPRGTEGQVEFDYDSYHVTVESQGAIILQHAGSATDG